jgi:hypothetical protein
MILSPSSSVTILDPLDLSQILLYSLVICFDVLLGISSFSFIFYTFWADSITTPSNAFYPVSRSIINSKDGILQLAYYYRIYVVYFICYCERITPFRNIVFFSEYQTMEKVQKSSRPDSNSGSTV